MNNTDHPIVVAYGGGTNSKAMLCGFKERGIIPSLILFADTGGELPHTYEDVFGMDLKFREWWGVGIEIVRAMYQGKPEGLEAECLRKRMLPSLAYGFIGLLYEAQSQTPGTAHQTMDERARSFAHCENHWV